MASACRAWILSLVMDLDLDHATIRQLVGWACERFAGGDAVLDTQDGGRTMTFAELGEAIDATAAGLVASGIELGDTVAVWAPNTWEWARTPSSGLSRKR